MFFHHGKIESLALQEPQYQDYFIHSPDGYVLGVKTKINPLVVYYNRDIFRQHGLELPTDGWDTVIQTHQAGAKGSQLNEGSEEWSVLIQEVRRSVPVSLMMNEGSQWTNHWSKSILLKLYRATKNGQTAKEVLEQYAEEFDLQFEDFKKDFSN